MPKLNGEWVGWYHELFQRRDLADYLFNGGRNIFYPIFIFGSAGKFENAGMGLAPITLHARRGDTRLGCPNGLVACCD